MIASSFIHRLALAAAVGVTLDGGSRLQAQDASLPESVRVALARYADLDPLAVNWSETPEATPLGRQKIAADILARATGRTMFFQFAFRGGRFYLRRETTKDSPNQLPAFEISFNGNMFYGGNPGGELQNPKGPKDRPFLHKWLPKNDGHPEGNQFTTLYFQTAGIRMPSPPNTSARGPQAELLALLAEGARVEETGPAELEGRPLIRVRMTVQEKPGPTIDLAKLEHQLRLSPAMSEEKIQRQLQEVRKSQERPVPQRRCDFYLDPKCAYALRRLETRDEAGHLLTRSDCTAFEQLPGRVVWLPRRCQLEGYAVNNQIFESPSFVTQFQVKTFDVKPWPDDRFELKYTTPGTYVNDATFPEVKEKDGVFYEIPANPQQLNEVISAARDKYGSRQ